VLTGINELDIGNLSKNRYINQLRVLVQLRNLEQPLEDIMLKLSDFFKVERDPCYRIGEKKGIEKGIEKGMKGKEKALENQALTIAREMKLEGLSTLLISKITALSTKEIEKL
jgi:predicted transposase YdaD